jgi:hypothetical protein
VFPGHAEHAAALAAFEDLAEEMLARGLADEAAGAAQTGASVAVMNHPGAFASPRLDRVLLAVARELGPAREWHGRGDDPRRVLHVHSHAVAVGGQTRLGTRVIESDRGRVHDLLVTAPIAPTPPALLHAVHAGGGRELPTTANRPTLLERAAALRETALGYDAVILYLDPHDPAPAIAFGGLTRRPPVLSYDVADHTFALGRHAIDLDLAFRPKGAQLARDHRGLPPERVAVLPLPIPAPRAGDPAATRAALGLGPDDLLLVTVAAAYKYESGTGDHLLDLVEPILRERPDVHLVAAGPEPEGRWLEAHERTGGRVRALGVTEGLPLVAAADVVLESYPVGGGTLLLEAAGLERALLGYAPDPDAEELLSSGSSSGGGCPRPRTPQAYRAALLELIADHAGREAAGRAAREATLLSHEPGLWRDGLARCYARAAELGPVRPDELAATVAPSGRDGDIVGTLHAQSGKVIAPHDVERVLASERLILADGYLRAQFRHVPGGYPRPNRRFDAALAAPAPDTASIGAAVALMRDIAAAQLARRHVLTLSPADVEGAIPLIEAALEDGGEFELELTPADEPAALVTPDTLLVAVPGDRLFAAA